MVKFVELKQEQNVLKTHIQKERCDGKKGYSFNQLL